ncbi:MAG: hypothetical protein ABI700_07630 [Chloroflexota bacterium]
MINYTYRAFDLRIASQIELPELRPQSIDQADFYIKFGAVPADLANPSSISHFFQRNRSQFRLDIPQIAAFWVENGRTIIVEPHTDQIDLVRALLLDTVMVALLYQRDLCVLHASCIDTPNGAVILANTRGGNGCSTLAAALRLRGYPLAADIFTAVNVPQSTPPLALPAYPFQLLWRDSLKQLGIPVKDSPALTLVRAALKKYVVRLGDDFIGTARPIWRIYILQADMRLEIAPVSGLQKLSQLERLLYHGPFQEANQARALVALGQSAQTFTLHHPLSWDLSALVAAFEAHLNA